MKISVIGAGTMGTQIALYCAMYGFDVSLFSRTEEGKKKAKEKIVAYIELLRLKEKMNTIEITKALNQIKVSNQLERMIADADIIIETALEDSSVKKNLFREISEKCKDSAVIVTNSSSFLPSEFVNDIKYPERFCAMHFYSYIWNTRIVDIMYHPNVSESTKESVTEFAKELELRPIVLNKEKNGYVFNSLLNELFLTSIGLVVDNVTSIEDIDASWKSILDTKIGPFGIMDVVGIDTVYKIVEQQSIQSNSSKDELASYLQFLKTYLEEGKKGVKTGKGFYQYT